MQQAVRRARSLRSSMHYVLCPMHFCPVVVQRRHPFTPKARSGASIMLSVQDNEYLSRIGPGTAMGNLMRQYWMPAIRSDELPAPDCPPLRVKLLGEELLGYRTTSGAVGLIQ